MKNSLQKYIEYLDWEISIIKNPTNINVHISQDDVPIIVVPNGTNLNKLESQDSPEIIRKRMEFLKSNSEKYQLGILLKIVDSPYFDLVKGEVVSYLKNTNLTNKLKSL
jgi:hypothetical protein